MRLIDADKLLEAMCGMNMLFSPKIVIDAQPTVGDVQRWISVDERLPEDDYECVLVYLDTKCYDIAIWHNEYKFRPWYSEYFQDCTPEWSGKVLAWMPLPEYHFDGVDKKVGD